MTAALRLANNSKSRLSRLLGSAPLEVAAHSCCNIALSKALVTADVGRTAAHLTPGLRWQHDAARLSPSEPKTGERQVLYKGAWMVPFRTLVRLKIFQLSGVAAAAVPLGTFLSQGGVSAFSLAVASALLVGCGISASTLNFYSRRYVGQLSLMTQLPPSPPLLCISVLDFWGHREDNYVMVDALVPPLKGLEGEGLKKVTRQPLIPLDVQGDRQYFISLRFGHVPEKQAFLRLLQGTHDCQL